MNAKLNVSFKDRIGIVADISRLIAQHGMNIASMEVVRKMDEAHVYVEVESGKNLKHLDLPGYALLKCLEGERIIDVKQNLTTSAGRYQYISTCKPIRDAFGEIVGAVEIAKDIQGIKRLPQRISDPRKISFSDIIGDNATVKEAIAFAQKIAGSDAAVSIRGAGGTGKELFARAIHTASNRSGPFIPINCAALPEQLLESELFGYVRGAFTGGRKSVPPGPILPHQCVAIHIPPLNQRPEDIAGLVEHFLFQLGSKLEKRVPLIGDDALRKLCTHDWPGNVRELKNVVNRAAIICEDDTIGRDCIFFSHELGQGLVSHSAIESRSGKSSKEQVAELEQRILVDTLQHTKSIRQAARRLQISHPALLKKMRKYAIQRTVKVTTR